MRDPGICGGREAELKREAATALAQFDQDQWNNWSDSLPHRAEPIALNKPILEHLALEHWTQARHLHARALRNPLSRQLPQSAHRNKKTSLHD